MISNDRIPNNVNLSDDRRLQRALEKWQPNYLEWWMEMGPEGFQAHDVYLRTAISVEDGGWANYGHVKMPDYRWGIFLSPPIEGRKIGFGDDYGKDLWDVVPGEHRNSLRRLIVTQGDTEPASVEQQRELGQTCPSLYDLRNLFQVNVEEGRHLWAMVYLLHSYFGRDGREEAEDLLHRRSGLEDSPRLLEAFNQPCEDWLTFFCFTMFTDRDGKFQLAALAESSFDPLARTTRFMLTEEAHHLFVGVSGLERIIQRSAELTKADPNGDARNQGGIDLETIQKYVNRWFSFSLDLFGSENSSNAAEFFAAGLKGRYREAKYEDHLALEGVREMEILDKGVMTSTEIPLRNAMNEQLREEYVLDCLKGVKKWNRVLTKAGLDFQITLPSIRFHRGIGVFADGHFDPTGNLIDHATFSKNQHRWLPTPEDEAFVKSLMKPVIEPGKMANWISPPKKGINGTPIDYEFVRTDY